MNGNSLSFKFSSEFYGAGCWHCYIVPTLQAGCIKDYMKFRHGYGLDPDGRVLTVSVSWLFWSACVKLRWSVVNEGATASVR